LRLLVAQLCSSLRLLVAQLCSSLRRLVAQLRSSLRLLVAQEDYLVYLEVLALLLKVWQHQVHHLLLLAHQVHLWLHLVHQVHPRPLLDPLVHL
jgi:hypothetical protein